jgi:threonine/homoserine/homoserine lactone efflux protein
MTAQFLLTSLVIVVTPGTGVLYTLAAGLSRGTRASIIAAIGCTLGVVPQMLGAVLGLAALFQASAAAFQTIKYLGVLYLLYMAVSTLRDEGLLRDAPETSPQSAKQVIASAILLNVLNPKLTIFFFAFLPQFVDSNDSHALSRMVGLSMVFMTLTFVVFVIYGIFAAMIRQHVISRPRVLKWMRRTFAGAFVALGAKLALAER